MRNRQPARAFQLTTVLRFKKTDGIPRGARRGRGLSPHPPHARTRTATLGLRSIRTRRGADAAFTNLEMLFHDYEPYAMNESGGTYMRAEPALVKDLVWAGFDLVSRANNHTGDYGVLGHEPHHEVRRRGRTGAGRRRAEPRRGARSEVPRDAEGRVALISVASTFPDHSRAGRTRGDMPARPGLNPLRFTTITT